MASMLGLCGARSGASTTLQLWRKTKMKMRKNHIGSLLVSLLLVLVSVSFVPRAWADVTGTILGTVIDATGAKVPGVRVTLTNTGTGLNRELTTDANGAYEFLAVPIGAGYAAEVEAQGFSKSRQSSITLTVNQTLRLDFRMTVGQVAEKVEVTADTNQVETSTNQLGNVIESNTIVAVPLNGRSYTDLLALQPGVAPVQSISGGGETGRQASGNLDPGLLSVNGARESANAFIVNGGDVNESRDNGTAIVPNLDAIAEFRILTGSYDPEYGKFAGGIINVVTKSGTDSLHGNVFEFLRNNVFDAANYLSPTKAALRQNEFGGTLGGALIKNRLFFFVDYQGTRLVQGVAQGPILVPSLAERSGTFSNLAGTVNSTNSAGNFAQALSQRLGYAVSGGEPYYFAGCSSNAQCVFPGQTIPQAAWSSAAVGTLQFIPGPNTTSNGAPAWTNASQSLTLRDDKFGERIDWTRSEKDSWSFYSSFDDNALSNPYAGGNGPGQSGADVPGFPGRTPARGQQANIRNVHSIGQRAVTALTLNYTRFSLTTNVPSGSSAGDPSKWGFVSGGLGIIPSAPQYAGVPHVDILGSYSTSFGAPSSIQKQADNTFQVSDTYTQTVGKHTLGFGGDVRYYQINTRQFIEENGVFGFSGGETGNAFADFLLGAPATYAQASTQEGNVRTKYFAAFAQDNYKILPNLTLNYGLRWEANEPYYDTLGLMMTFIPGEQSTVFPDAPTGWVFPGDRGVPKTISTTRWNNIAPRVGIVYSPNNKTSIRGGYGIFYTSYEELIANYEVGDAPFGNFYNSAVPVYLEEPFKNRATTNDPGQRFPSYINLPGTKVDFAQYEPIGGSQTWDPRNVLPSVEQFNLTLQRELPQSMVLTVGYVGSLGRHLIAQRDLNPGNAALCLSVSQANQVMPGSPTCGPFSEAQVFQRADGQFVNGTGPYSVTSGRNLPNSPDFANIPDMATVAPSSYNALQVGLQRKAGPLSFLVGYTYSKSLDLTSGFVGPYVNPYNSQSSWALSSFNVTHNFVATYLYELPFQKWSNASSGIERVTLSGWALSGITRFATGQPVRILQSGDYALCGCGGSLTDVDKPNYLGALRILNPRKSDDLYFSPTAFASEAGTMNNNWGQGGDSKRAFFSGPGIDNWDVALHKSTHIGERVSTEFRLEFFNVFNHAQFQQVQGDFSAANFGAVTSVLPPRIGQVAVKVNF
jgi:hypothetical protein